MDQEHTQVVTLVRDIDLLPGDRLHCLEFTDGRDIGVRHVIGPLGVRIGRTPPSDIILAESEVSRAHCTVALFGDQLIITDLSSTNGSFVDGRRITAPTPLPVGGILQVGNRFLKHEWRTRSEIAQSEEMERELQRAASYVQALLPPPVAEGAIRSEWVYQPCARLGGDAFGYGDLSERHYVAYLVDVSGHGAGAAMHAVAAMNQLRQHALPDTDMTDPAQVLTTLNRLFQMDEHAGLYFTIWYGVYDRQTRQMRFASAGHHPAFLMPADRSDAIPLKTRNGIIGAMPGTQYRSDAMAIPAGASLYLFSDGVFEIVTRDGAEWTLHDFLPMLLEPPGDGLPQVQRLFRGVRERARPGGPDDDFSLVMLTFD